MSIKLKGFSRFPFNFQWNCSPYFPHNLHGNISDREYHSIASRTAVLASYCTFHRTARRVATPDESGPSRADTKRWACSARRTYCRSC